MNMAEYLYTATLTISTKIDPNIFHEKVLDALESVLDTAMVTVLQTDKSACGFVGANYVPT
jgi:hypothetical protein